MTDKYKDLRDALAAGPAAWISQNTLTGADRYARVPIQSLQPGVYEHAPLYSIDPETIRALLEERDALREALRWAAGTLQSACCLAGPISESSPFRLGDETRTVAQICDAADVALAQHQGEKHGNQ